MTSYLNIKLLNRKEGDSKFIKKNALLNAGYERSP